MYILQHSYKKRVALLMSFYVKARLLDSHCPAHFTGAHHFPFALNVPSLALTLYFSLSYTAVIRNKYNRNGKGKEGREKVGHKRQTPSF